jgi:hypothetical protein
MTGNQRTCAATVNGVPIAVIIETVADVLHEPPRQVARLEFAINRS